MLADFYIPRLSNDLKIAVQKNHLVGQIVYISLVPSQKNGVIFVVRHKIPYGRYGATTYFVTIDCTVEDILSVYVMYIFRYAINHIIFSYAEIDIMI